MGHLKLQCWSLAIPFQSKFTHNQKARSVSSTFWVQVEWAGHTGFGEGCPRPYVTGETLAQCQGFFERHEGSVSREIHDLPSLQDYRNAHAEDVSLNPSAWCAIELALLDAFARASEISVETLLGLPALNWTFQYSGVLGVDSPNTFAQKLQAHVALEVPDYKLKWSEDASANCDRLAHIQSSVPGALIRIDANNLWGSVDDSIRALLPIANAIWAVEEPLAQPAMTDALKIANETGLRVILDEAVLNENDLIPYLDFPEAFIFNLRVSKCGGVLSGLEMARSCRKSGLPVVVGAQVGETSILTRAALPIAQFLGAACRAQEGAYGLHLLQRDVVSHSMQFGRGGRLLPPPIFHGFGWGLDCNLNGLDEPRAC